MRRALAASALALLVIGSTGIGVTSIVSQPAVAEALRQEASVLAKRSPGARGLALLMTKHKRAPAPTAAAAEHAGGPKPAPAPAFGLTEVGPPPPEVALAAPPPGLPGVAGPAGVPEELPVAALPLAAVPPGLSFPGEGVGVPGIGGPGVGPILVSGPPGGGGGGGDTPITITPTPTPEPSVWAMLILGFFGVGAALRARRGARLADGRTL